MKPPRTLCILLMALQVFCAATSWAVGREQRVKATFIYHFAKFITWKDALGQEGSPFVIGTYGADACAGELEPLVRGKTVTGHPIEIRRIRADAEIRGCRILVTGATGAERIDQLSMACRPGGTVMVGESPLFAKFGGTIGLVVVEDGRVRFDVNLRSERGSSYKVSSKMLSVARHVYK